LKAVDLKILSSSLFMMLASLLAVFGYFLEIWGTDLGSWWVGVMLVFFLAAVLIASYEDDDDDWDDWDLSEKNDGVVARYPVVGNSEPLTEKRNKLRCSYCNAETNGKCGWTGCNNGVCQKCKSSGRAQKHYKKVGEKKAWHGQWSRVEYIRSGHRCKTCSQKDTRNW